MSFRTTGETTATAAAVWQRHRRRQRLAITHLPRRRDHRQGYVFLPLGVDYVHNPLGLIIILVFLPASYTCAPVFDLTGNNGTYSNDLPRGSSSDSCKPHLCRRRGNAIRVAIIRSRGAFSRGCQKYRFRRGRIRSGRDFSVRKYSSPRYWSLTNRAIYWRLGIIGDLYPTYTFIPLVKITYVIYTP